jgi:hypothetical protein
MTIVLTDADGREGKVTIETPPPQGGVSGEKFYTKIEKAVREGRKRDYYERVVESLSDNAAFHHFGIDGEAFWKHMQDVGTAIASNPALTHRRALSQVRAVMRRHFIRQEKLKRQQAQLARQLARRLRHPLAYFVRDAIIEFVRRHLGDS